MRKQQKAHDILSKVLKNEDYITDSPPTIYNAHVQ